MLFAKHILLSKLVSVRELGEDLLGRSCLDDRMGGGEAQSSGVQPPILTNNLWALSVLLCQGQRLDLVTCPFLFHIL